MGKAQRPGLPTFQEKLEIWVFSVKALLWSMEKQSFAHRPQGRLDVMPRKACFGTGLSRTFKEGVIYKTYGAQTFRMPPRGIKTRTGQEQKWVGKHKEQKSPSGDLPW